MRALAAYIMRGPLQAMLVTAALALFSLIPVLSVISVLSGGALALVTLRHGLKQGLIVMLGAGVITGAFMYFIFGTMELGLVYTVLLWLPVLLLAVVLRGTASWSMLIDAAAALGLIGIVAFYLATGDPVQFWHNVLSRMVQLMASQGGGVPEMDVIQQQLPVFARWLTGMLAGGVIMGLILSLVVGRWWQGLLYNPGGFKAEFFALRQSRISSIVVVVILGLSVAGLGQVSNMAGDMMIVIVMVYSLVGLALVHAVIASRGMHVAWLVVLYILLFILPPQIMMLLTSIGFVDCWVNFRGRLASVKKKTDDERHDNQ
jgi:hypothetical protein